MPHLSEYDTVSINVAKDNKLPIHRCRRGHGFESRSSEQRGVLSARVQRKLLPFRNRCNERAPHKQDGRHCGDYRVNSFLPELF